MYNPTVREGRSAGNREEAREETGEKIVTLIQADSSLTMKEIVERL
ncbi:hypothetical protein [Methanocalculus taiwanensis]|nr:hypothetical protein [Methanocalculus taiwanensis]